MPFLFGGASFFWNLASCVELLPASGGPGNPYGIRRYGILAWYGILAVWNFGVVWNFGWRAVLDFCGVWVWNFIGQVFFSFLCFSESVPLDFFLAGCRFWSMSVWNLGVLYWFCTKFFFVPVFPDFFPACRPAGCSPHVFNFSARTARDFSIGPRYGISGRQSQSSRWSHGVNWPLQRRLHPWPRGYPLKILGVSVVVAPDSTCVRIGQLPPHPMMRWASLHGKYIALKKIHDFFSGFPRRRPP